MKTIAVTIAVLIATLACYVAWADFPDECEPHERESDHRQALCKWNRGELTIESMEFQAYPVYPNCRIRFRFHLPDGALPPIEGMSASVSLHTGNDEDRWRVVDVLWATERHRFQRGMVSNEKYIDIPLSFLVAGFASPSVPMNAASVPRVYSINQDRVFTKARLDVFVPSRGPQGGNYKLSAETDVPDSLNARDVTIGACLDSLQQIHEDKLHAEAEATRQHAELEAARLAAEAAKLEEEQAIREAETQARINEAKLEAANESKRRVLEAERITTQTLITKIENEKAVAGILFEITRIRLRGTEERAALTNEWLEERARETEAFSQEIVSIEESIQSYNEFNRAFLDSIQRYQADIETRVAEAERQLQEFIDEATALNDAATGDPVPTPTPAPADN